MIYELIMVVCVVSADGKQSSCGTALLASSDKKYVCKSYNESPPPGWKILNKSLFSLESEKGAPNNPADVRVSQIDPHDCDPK